MPYKYPFTLVSVFHDPKLGFKGNTAAVIQLSTAIRAEKMQSIALDFNQPATSFIWPSNERNVHHIRWFAPDSEIALCGHGSLAAIAVLCQHSGDTVVLKYALGEIIGSRIDKDNCTMTIEAISNNEQQEIPQIINEGLGVTALGYFTTGNKEIVLVKNEEVVKELRPNFELLKSSDVFGYIVTAKGDKADFVSRTIVPHISILEDPATGSSHAALVPFWSERLNKNHLLAYQLSERGGRFENKIEGNSVHLSGMAHLWAQGNL